MWAVNEVGSDVPFKHELVDMLAGSGASVNALPEGVADSVPCKPLGPGERTEYYTASGQPARASARKDSMRGWGGTLRCGC